MGPGAYQDPAVREGRCARFIQAGSPATPEFHTWPRSAWYRADPGYVAIHPGDILAGYRVTRLLGRGGMGEVLAAVDDQGSALSGAGDGQRLEVAIKVLLARAAMKPDLVRRFEREARIASAINSPYVSPIQEGAAANDGA